MFNCIFDVDCDTFIIEHINLFERQQGNFSRLVRNLGNHGYEIQVLKPAYQMREILSHLGFIQVGEDWIKPKGSGELRKIPRFSSDPTFEPFFEFKLKLAPDAVAGNKTSEII